MTRMELIEVFSVFNACEDAPFNQDEQDVEDKVLAHDQSQREEIARLTGLYFALQQVAMQMFDKIRGELSREEITTYLDAIVPLDKVAPCDIARAQAALAGKLSKG